MILTKKVLERINDKEGILALLKEEEYDLEKIIAKLEYQEELEALQAELLKLQNDFLDKGKKLLLIFEGRDAAGKGGSIQRLTKYLMPRHHRVVALPKPTEVERGQWYFQRYVQRLPTEGEIVLFDRSWYNRAVVEPVNDFCKKSDYRLFMEQVNGFEKMLIESDTQVIKFWLDISKEEQAKRFDERRNDPLKQWKIGPVDAKAQELWDDYTYYKNEMLAQTSSSHCPWVLVDANNKRHARLEIIRYVLHNIDYKGKNKAKVSLTPNPTIIGKAKTNITTG